MLACVMNKELIRAHRHVLSFCIFDREAQPINILVRSTEGIWGDAVCVWVCVSFIGSVCSCGGWSDECLCGRVQNWQSLRPLTGQRNMLCISGPFTRTLQKCLELKISVTESVARLPLHSLFFLLSVFAGSEVFGLCLYWCLHFWDGD